MTKGRPIQIEACVTSLAAARVAARAGVDRLELTTGLPLGGLTPSLGLVRAVNDAPDVSVPAIALIRPREGGFRYHADEIRVAEADLEAFEAEGTAVAGYAVGALDDAGDLDLATLRRWREIAPEKEWCLHRAFDHVRDPLAALEQAIDLGFDRILTSGLAASAPEGSEQIAALVLAARDRIEIMPGGGVSATSALPLLEGTGVRSLHLSGTAWAEPAGPVRSGIALGAGAAPDEVRHLEVREERIAALVRAVRAEAPPTTD